MDDKNICLTGDEARLLIRVLLEGVFKGKESFIVVSILQRLNDISVVQPPRS